MSRYFVHKAKLTSPAEAHRWAEEYPGPLYVQVSPGLLAEVMGVPYVTPDGSIVTMESADIFWNDILGVHEAEPIFTKRVPQG